jgi:hypothetical protein
VIPDLALSFLVLLARADAGPSGPAVRAGIHPQNREIEIFGLDPAALQRASRDGSFPRWSSLCRVLVRGQPNQPAASLPIRGTYQVRNATLVFRARYPLDQPGYRIVIDADLLGETLRRVRTEQGRGGPVVLDLDAPHPGPPPAPTTLTAVYPSAQVLPENLLRFYLYFSGPMSRGEAYRHIRLLDSTGKPVTDPFLEIDEELWSTDGRRFTLLFDPGRVKRGLKPNSDLGPPLRQGNEYTLEIDRSWRDAQGNPLAARHRFRFRAGPPDRSPPSPQDWVILPPHAGTRDALEVRFAKPLDEALARRLIKVSEQPGRFVDGKITLDQAETRWHFTPESPWEPRAYRLVVSTDLEDPSGNAVGRPFEVDLVGPISAEPNVQTVSRSFLVQRGKRGD